jgi:predicted DNA-binding transcriptional regulator AlpA
MTMDNSGATHSLDLVWGVAVIAKLIGRTERQTYHMINSGHLPMVKQVGERYVASRAKLIAFFMEDAA